MNRLRGNTGPAPWARLSMASHEGSVLSQGGTSERASARIPSWGIGPSNGGVWLRSATSKRPPRMAWGLAAARLSNEEVRHIRMIVTMIHGLGCNTRAKGGPGRPPWVRRLGAGIPLDLGRTLPAAAAPVNTLWVGDSHVKFRNLLWLSAGGETFTV